MNNIKKTFLVGTVLLATTLQADPCCPPLWACIAEKIFAPIFRIKNNITRMRDKKVNSQFLKKSPVDKIKYLQTHGCAYEEMMSVAIVYQDLEFAKAILEKAQDNFDINQRGVPYCILKYDYIYRNYNDDTLLKEAVSWAQDDAGYEIVKLLLEHGANPNQIGHCSEIPLEVALRNHSHKMVTLLLEHGANPNQRNGLGYMPLHRAIYERAAVAIPMIELLVKYGADINALEPIMDRNPLLAAVMERSANEIIECLLKNGADVNFGIGHEDYCTSLYMAVNSNDYEKVKLLLEYEANPNKKDYLGATPLFWARNKKLVDLLVKHGASIDVKDNEGKTPLHYNVQGIFYERQREVVEAFINLGIDVNVQDVHGKTALNYAIDANEIGLNNEETKKLLITAGKVQEQKPVEQAS